MGEKLRAEKKTENAGNCIPIKECGNPDLSLLV